VSAIAVTGRVEGDESAVAPKTSGRILEVRVREGDRVNAGDTIARLDDSQIRSREERARLAVTVAEAREQAARRQIAVFEEQLQQGELQTGQATVDASGRVEQADADLAGAEAELARSSIGCDLGWMCCTR
jgi:membrane fusion protein YbhG